MESANRTAAAAAVDQTRNGGGLAKPSRTVALGAVAAAGRIGGAGGAIRGDPPSVPARGPAPSNAIRATREIADACTFSLDDFKYQYPNEPVPHGHTPDG